MIDSTNPRIMADNIRHLSEEAGSQASDISTLQTTVGSQGDAIEALQTYSATEVKTGLKYGDDDIYRKTFTLEGLPNNSAINIPHGVDNIGIVFQIYGFMQSSPTENVDGRTIPSAAISVFYRGVNIRISTTTDLSTCPAVLVFEYTKSAAPTSLTSPAPDDTRSIEPEEREEDPIIDESIEEPVVEVKKTTTRKKTTN